MCSPLFKNKNREQFYDKSLIYYNRIKETDADLWGLHIIHPDNLSFIRVHKPEAADDYIPLGKKTLIDFVNSQQEYTTSFDDGKYGCFLRIVIPVFSLDQEYLGAAEYSVNVQSLTDYIHTQLNFNVLFLVDNINGKEFLDTLPTTPDGLTIFEVTDIEIFESNEYSDTETISDLKSNFSSSITEFPLSKTAKLLVAYDLSDMLASRELFISNITVSMVLIMVLFSALWIIVTLTLVSHKKDIDNKLNEFIDIINKNIIYINTDIDGNISSISDAFCDVTGFSENEIISTHQSMNSFLDYQTIHSNEIFYSLQKRDMWEGDLLHETKLGQEYWTHTTITPFYNNKNEKVGYSLISQDITDKKIIEKISITDSLTKLYNRRYFDSEFDRQVNIAKRRNEYLGFIMIDIDFFKQYNDHYGHQEGDDVLRQVSSALHKTVHRAGDYCFRLGGEEFGVLLTIVENENIIAFAEQIRKNVEELEITHCKNCASDFITVSMGVWCKRIGAEHTTDSIYKAADTLLYKAKESGRNRVSSDTEIEQNINILLNEKVSLVPQL